MPTKPFRNPYLNRSMVRDPSQFYGRRREVERVMQRLSASPPQSVSIVGDRRVGKSSLLAYISHPDIVAQYFDDPENTIFLFIDFQEAPNLSVEVFYESVFRHLRAALGQRLTIDAPADAGGFRQVLAELKRCGINLVLLLDEFDRVTSSTGFGAGFFANLRALAGHHNVAFVTSSDRELQEWCQTDETADSLFFNIFTSMVLGPLTEEEARELVTAPAVGAPIPITDSIDHILELGGHWPFFLQVAASSVFEILSECGEARHDLIRRRFAEEVMPHFQFFWGHLDPVARGICNDIASGQIPDDDATVADLTRRGFILEGPRLFSSCFADYIRDTYAKEVGERPIEVQAERARELESEVEKARQLQMSLLPRSMPQAAGLEFAAAVVPATEVSGDFYTFLELDEGRRLAIVAADVCGHGMEGAIVAMRFSETIRYESRGLTRPGEILEGLNRALHGTLTGGFVGCCICVLDLRTAQVEVSIGGYHPPLLLRQDGGISEPELGALPLGVRANTQYPSAQLQLEVGDTLFMFSDGVIEASDNRQAEYGQDRLQALLQQTRREDLSLSALIDRVLGDVERFSAGTAQADDITVIGLRHMGLDGSEQPQAVRAPSAFARIVRAMTGRG